MRQVVATAGHVDHGKSTLIRALTGTDPDRLREEKQRGLTIELGFAGMTLPSGTEVSFVDVPGHERFLGTMLAGLGPAPIVCFVIAADEGWSAQSGDHRDALEALGIDQGLIVITRTDLAPGSTDPTLSRARAELAGTGLADAPAVAVSAMTGDGMDQLRDRLDEVVRSAPEPSATQRVRLWVDRSFPISGAGTVVTGTLPAGTLARGDRLELAGDRRGGVLTVRGLQHLGGHSDRLVPVTRAAVNLRGVAAEEIGRGDALLTPGTWTRTGVLDVRRMSGDGFESAPAQLMVHLGTATVAARVRPLGADHARFTLDRPLPLTVGDRLVLRATSSRAVRGGALVLDLDPPRLDRRGDGRRRALTLTAMSARGDAAAEVARRGAMREDTLVRAGIVVPAQLPETLARHGSWLVDAPALQSWSARLRELVAADRDADALSPGLPRKAAADALELPHPDLLAPVLEAAGLHQVTGRIRETADADSLGPAEPAVRRLEQRLGAHPFVAPEADELVVLGLGPRELAAAARQRRLLRLPGEVILLPTAPALAMRELAALPQPFTTSQARQALGTTRRIAIPLLEHLDARGWTRRPDPGHREIVR
ncbi:MAG: selenocysteine-specific translation elongation factor [Brachybacterium sp.]|uniref:selenocysteine-specific translation elongation factor n=1 Tax=Brachybacterium sp. TaxID=1891286 RepID=UPI002648A9BC|nr:selenocysteine-specific translation elongation factor [Brachybacterium sp.]MDN5685823.1 selenocysteine-specific translation elongation factor [Brachybacterium sp.]